jgi:hypothetical protein
MNMSIIKSNLEKLNENIIGWYGLLLPVLLEVEKNNKANQENKTEVNINEKYGGLQIDLSGGDMFLHKMAIKAEQESHNVCQLCGAKGKTTWIQDWCMTLCDNHAKARKKANHDEEKTRLLYLKYIKKQK